MAASSLAGGGACAVAVRLGEAAPPAAAHGRGGGDGPWLAASVRVGEASEGVAGLEIWHGEWTQRDIPMGVSEEGAPALVAGLALARRRGYEVSAPVLQYMLRIATAESNPAAGGGGRGRRPDDWASSDRAAAVRALMVILARTRYFTTPQLCDLESGVGSIAATHGRLVDMVQRWRISLESIYYLVMDEAMMDMEFEPQMRHTVDIISKSVRRDMLFMPTFPLEIQLCDLESGVGSIVVAPGRLVDMVGRSRISLGAVKYLVTDEADRIHMEFEPQMRNIVDMILKSARKDMLFGATFPLEIQSLNSHFLSVIAGKLGSTTHMIEQKIDITNYEGKMGFLKQPDYTTNLNSKRKHSAKQHIGISGVRLFIFAIVLFSGVKSVSGVEYGTNRSMFCPASNIQFKRTSRQMDGWITELSEPMLLESTLEEKEETECKIVQYDENGCIKPCVYQQFCLPPAAGLLLISNLAPLVPINGRNVNPGRRMLLCLSSLALLVSNLSWVLYFGPNNCKNWIGYISLLFGCFCHGYFAWFFWQRENYVMKSVSSVIAAVVSAALTALLGFAAKADFMKVGPQILTGSSTVSGLGGVSGIIFNAMSIYLRTISASHRFDILPFGFALCGAIVAGLSIIATEWRNGTTQLAFKIGLVLLFGGRVFDVVLFCCFRDAPVAAFDNNEIIAPLLGTESGARDHESTDEAMSNQEEITDVVGSMHGNNSRPTGDVAVARGADLTEKVGIDAENGRSTVDSQTKPAEIGGPMQPNSIRIANMENGSPTKPAHGSENVKLDEADTELQLPTSSGKELGEADTEKQAIPLSA